VGTVVPTYVFALAGVSSTGSVGTVKAGVAPALTGVPAYSQMGSITYLPALTGNFATGFVGSVAIGARTIALTGISSTTAVGTAGVSRPFALTGNSASGSIGNFYLTKLTGNSATGAVGTVIPTKARAITGVSSTTAVGTLTPTKSFAIIGNSATGQVGSVGAFYWGLIDTNETPGWTVIDQHTS
jgi:hypothetical protein